MKKSKKVRKGLQKITNIAVNVLYSEKDKIHSTYVPKHNSNCKKQAILLMISNEEKMEAKSERSEV